MKYTARVGLDADENRVVWLVMVYDESDTCVERRPFRDKEDALEYAELVAGKQHLTVY